MKITAAVTREKSGPFIVEEIELEEPRDNEVLVKVVGVGVCHTDLACRDQYFPVPLPSVFGHEGSGIVEKVGKKVAKVKPGDPVVMSILNCGECVPCKQGKVGYCLNVYGANFSGGRLDGSTTMKKGSEVIHGSFFGQSSFATYALAEERNVVKVREDAPLEKLGPLGCGVQTGAGGVMVALHPNPGSSIAIFGMGSVGLSAVLGAVVCGCTKIIGIDVNPDRLKFSKELGATHVVNPKEVDSVKAIQEITGGGANYTLECTGIPQVFRQAVDALCITGTCGLIGVSPLGTEVSLDMNGILFGRTVRGIMEGDAIPDIFIPQMVELYMQGRFPFDKLIQFYSFNDINKAVEDSEKGIVLKPVLRLS